MTHPQANLDYDFIVTRTLLEDGDRAYAFEVDGETFEFRNKEEMREALVAYEKEELPPLYTKLQEIGADNRRKPKKVYTNLYRVITHMFDTRKDDITEMVNNLLYRVLAQTEKEYGLYTKLSEIVETIENGKFEKAYERATRHVHIFSFLMNGEEYQVNSFADLRWVLGVYMQVMPTIPQVAESPTSTVLLNYTEEDVIRYLTEKNINDPDMHIKVLEMLNDPDYEWELKCACLDMLEHTLYAQMNNRIRFSHKEEKGPELENGKLAAKKVIVTKKVDEEGRIADIKVTNL